MDTPTHVVVNLLLVGPRVRRTYATPVALGALAPDVPMFLFYAAERLRGATEEQIWTGRYFDAGWQLFFDVFNSLPIIAVAALVAWRLGWPAWLAFFVSMGLHGVCDLLVHHDDAHRHFLPFSDWRFASPVSYWDPAHHGRTFLAVSLAGLVAGCAWLLRPREPFVVRVIAGGTLAVSATFLLFALTTWGAP